MKISLKSLLFLFSYILICIGLLILAENQSTEQPIGLLFVAMVTTPFIISICGGLPIDCLQPERLINQNSSANE
jgi:hypothetical protein